jgi:hypothetical protein
MDNIKILRDKILKEQIEVSKSKKAAIRYLIELKIIDKNKILIIPK